MALIECAECGNQVSDKAAACPRCGAPVNAAPTIKAHIPPPARAVTFTPMTVGAIILAVVAVFSLALFVRGFQRSNGAWSQSQDTANEQAKDRRTIEFCEERYKEMNADRQYTPDMLQFHAKACSQLREDFQTRWGRAP
ncbi:TPA: zinc ribbon domain-containing protein [Stenotrophomonas maltophilia]|uniref:zinc-ribbon domain-containing protein n=1 Tax=Stenotrophomonas sp. GD03680 TaxID=2975365 RepID=UPI0018D29C9A|nr:zinc-ribbon domain-containing protein [Stenotrophomonas sp. GD03680]MBH1591940.1 zinc ribbon domain-containing protein [Stenotrophomonas maltophilia]MDH2022528.1 zinc-ribbon domain-containing protein [Stenotrophomonas sp. GD03680]HEL3748651.1 zinc ribbon domain-containing protein [Stenotrophomonas maltophilia]HEL7729599.1 zinc ribbon domain-containing protein [Stenotrophomonas maltophilia]